MKFKGTIVITDPCYIDTKDYKIWDGKGVDIYTGNGLGKLGFTNYIWRDTLYGDWSCTTFKIEDDYVNIKTSELKAENIEGSIGRFCADAGLVGVFLLDEILAFNPDFKAPVNEYGCEWATVIENFDGDIQYEVNHTKSGGEEAQIRGTGNINFVTRQTGF